MNVVFLSNYLSPHQRPLSNALAAKVNYTFIATKDMRQERKNMGWDREQLPPYVCWYDTERERAEDCITRADVVIAGSAPESLVQTCIRRNKLVLRYLERPLKKGPEWGKYLPRLVRWHIQNPPGRRVFLLCASAYTAGDYARFGLFRRKTLRWGYFPEVRVYPDGEIPAEKKEPASILWVGRFLPWKHPDDAVRVAARLKAEGMAFTLNMVGGGEMEPTLRAMITREGLEDRVRLLGSMPPEQVRGIMEKSEIFLFTSDRQEGWGAVLNEAMNSGCAVVASHAAGSTPYLIRDGENGLMYRSGDVESLHRNVRALLQDHRLCRRLGEAAYETMVCCWTPETAARRLVTVAQALLAGENWRELYAGGPGSPAEILREDWYQG